MNLWLNGGVNFHGIRELIIL